MTQTDDQGNFRLIQKSGGHEYILKRRPKTCLGKCFK